MRVSACMCLRACDVLSMYECVAPPCTDKREARTLGCF